MPDSWSVWRAELANPTPEERRLDRPTEPDKINGYWRSIGGKTKHDEPILIWTKEGAKATIFQRGPWDGQKRQPMNTTQHRAQWDQFIAIGWLKCVAVSKADYTVAMETGRWPDGKPAKPMSQDEKLGIAIPEGDNAPPKEESLADQITALAERLDEVPEPGTQEEANTISELLDRMRRLLQLAEDERVREKEPFLRGGQQVDAKWAGIKEPGKQAGVKAEARRKAFLKKEQDRKNEEARKETERLRKEADERAKAERERVAEETKKRLAEEVVQRLAEAAEGEAPPVMTEEEIAQRAAEAAAEAVPAPVVEEVKPERATAGSSYGVSRGLKKVKKGVIEDGPLFLATIWNGGNDELKALAQTLANRAAKTGIAVAGMKIVTVEE